MGTKMGPSLMARSHRVPPGPRTRNPSPRRAHPSWGLRGSRRSSDDHLGAWLMVSRFTNGLQRRNAINGVLVTSHINGTLWLFVT